MAWRIADSVVRGEIDNREKGLVAGKVWLLGRDEPIVLNLHGNGLRDVAGCLVTFANPNPRPGDHVDLYTDQNGFVGDITASRKVFVLDVSIQESMRLADAGLEIPKHRANSLYVEWFSRRNGRVVIETADFRIDVTEPAWTMTEDEHARQVESTHEAFREWLAEFDQLHMNSDTLDSDGEKPMDEFQWEKFMRESDQKSEKLGEIMAKYSGHPDCERLIAREMGWTWLEEELEAQERGILTSEEDESTEPLEIDLPEPDPAREGIDWVRGNDGDIHHPLALQAFNFSMHMWDTCMQHNLLGDESDADALAMTSQMQVTSSKLAGALNGIAFDRVIDNGYVVAGLKRALSFLHQAIDAGDRVRERNLLDPETLDSFHAEIFDVREKILNLMKDYRSR